MATQVVDNQHEATLRRLGEEITTADQRHKALILERDVALRAAVDDGVKVAVAARWCGLTESSAKWVLYAKDKPKKA